MVSFFVQKGGKLYRTENFEHLLLAYKNLAFSLLVWPEGTYKMVPMKNFHTSYEDLHSYMKTCPNVVDDSTMRCVSSQEAEEWANKLHTFAKDNMHYIKNFVERDDIVTAWNERVDMIERMPALRSSIAKRLPHDPRNIDELTAKTRISNENEGKITEQSYKQENFRNDDNSKFSVPMATLVPKKIH